MSDNGVDKAPLDYATVHALLTEQVKILDEAYRTKIEELTKKLEIYQQKAMEQKAQGSDEDELRKAIQAHVDVLVQQQIDKCMEKMINDKLEGMKQKRQGSIFQEVALIVSKLDQSPFSKEILNELPPAKFKIPEYNYFDGKGCPMMHIMHTKHVMWIYPASDALMCKVFAASLIEGAIRWFSNLEPNNIKCFKDLCNQFITKYLYSVGFKQ